MKKLSKRRQKVVKTNQAVTIQSGIVRAVTRGPLLAYLLLSPSYFYIYRFKRMRASLPFWSL